MGKRWSQLIIPELAAAWIGTRNMGRVNFFILRWFSLDFGALFLRVGGGGTWLEVGDVWAFQK